MGLFKDVQEMHYLSTVDAVKMHNKFKYLLPHGTKIGFKDYLYLYPDGSLREEELVEGFYLGMKDKAKDQAENSSWAVFLDRYLFQTGHLNKMIQRARTEGRIIDISIEAESAT